MSLGRFARVVPTIKQTALKSAQTTFWRNASNTMPLIFSSPGHEWYKNAEVQQVDLQASNSAMGILPAHVPTLAVLKPGKLTVKEENGDLKSFFVSSGTVTVNDDSSVQVLAEEAVPMDQLDANSIKTSLDKANAAMSSEQDPVKKAELQIQVDCYAAMAAVA